jgi:hypothetical protein
LSEAPGAVHYKDLTEKIIGDGLKTTVGATPSNIVYTQLITAMKADDCPFQRLGKGLFIWKQKVGITPNSTIPIEEPDDDEGQYEIISSFGMFWRRSAIDWLSTPKILGMQQIGATPVDFHTQVGIYLLYDAREVIYVGRSTDRPLGRRLFEHTKDRLSTRWDRFSWFGLRPVSQEGNLGSLPESYLGLNVIPALEAILIEALEPGQNRKRGDDLSAAEYIQMEDPEIQKKKKQQMLVDLLNKP